MTPEAQTLEQKIAVKALELVGGLRESGDAPSSAETEYRSQVEGLPAMLRSCGLARTLAFLKARGDAQKRIASHLEDQFRHSGIIGAESDLQKQLTRCSLGEYRVYARLALLVAIWHKRIAQAQLRRESHQ
jgi:CRISPR type III-B/RAMP module-associated protein Cmr5